MLGDPIDSPDTYNKAFGELNGGVLGTEQDIDLTTKGNFKHKLAESLGYLLNIYHIIQIKS